MIDQAYFSRQIRYRVDQETGPWDLRRKAWELSLSPNPSDGVFLLRASWALEGAKLHVYDLSGRSVLRQPMQGTALKLDLSQQPVGV